MISFERKEYELYLAWSWFLLEKKKKDKLLSLNCLAMMKAKYLADVSESCCLQVSQGEKKHGTF